MEVERDPKTGHRNGIAAENRSPEAGPDKHLDLHSAENHRQSDEKGFGNQWAIPLNLAAVSHILVV